VSHLLAILLAIPLVTPLIIVISLLYLLVDLYPQVKSFRAMLSTGSFWLLWVVFSVITGGAYALLATTKLSEAQGRLSEFGAKMITVGIAALTGITVLQSMSLRLWDSKIIDLQPLFDKYRAQVLADITGRNSRIERKTAFDLADKLFDKFQTRANELEHEFSQLLLVTLPDSNSVARQCEGIEQDSAKLNIPKVKVIATRIAIMDADRCRQILNREQKKT
jgi:hypothetical protein